MRRYYLHVLRSGLPIRGEVVMLREDQTASYLYLMETYYQELYSGQDVQITLEKL